MKIIKNVLLALAVLVILFFSLGFIKSSVNYGHEISTNKSIKEAWAVSQDASKLGLWLKGFKSIDLISGKEGEVGSKYKVVVNPGEGQPDFEMTETIVSKKEFELIELYFDSDMMEFDQTMTFTESEGKTHIKTSSKVKGKGPLMKSVFAFIDMLGNTFQTQETKNIESLKKVINENSTDYYPAPVEIIDSLIIDAIE